MSVITSSDDKSNEGSRSNSAKSVHLNWLSSREYAYQ